MADQPPSPSETAEAIRKKHLYRRLILKGKLALPREAATGLIGPDCAYHLYGRAKPEPASGGGDDAQEGG